MQLVLSGNRIMAHGENFLAMGGFVINTKTGAKYENATVAECDGCPSDIGQVGYEYHTGVFVPCAPYGKATDGEILIACNECATPRSSGVPISGITQIRLLWENAASKGAEFEPQTITLSSADYDFLLIVVCNDYYSAGSYGYRSEFTSIISPTDSLIFGGVSSVSEYGNTTPYVHKYNVCRHVIPNGANVEFKTGYYLSNADGDEIENNYICKPKKIYGVKACYI